MRVRCAGELDTTQITRFITGAVNHSCRDGVAGVVGVGAVEAAGMGATYGRCCGSRARSRFTNGR